jgi:hypothetical protein
VTAFTKSEGLPFEAWRKILDAQVRRRIVVGLDDLPDQPFRIWYDDDLAPADVLDEVLASA